MTSKRIITLGWCVLGLALGSGLGRAQPVPPPPPDWGTNSIPFGWTNVVWWTNGPPAAPTNSNPGWGTNLPPVWTNVPPILTNAPWAWTNTGFNPSWTNVASFTNAPPPPAPGDLHQRTVAAGQTGPFSLPTDARALVAQFQQQRSQLVKALNSASDQQRQQILGQMETLRQQLIEQLQVFRQQVIDRTHAQQGAFNNGGSRFGPGNAPQAPPASGGHGGPPRN